MSEGESVIPSRGGKFRSTHSRDINPSKPDESRYRLIYPVLVTIACKSSFPATNESDKKASADINKSCSPETEQVYLIFVSES